MKERGKNLEYRRQRKKEGSVNRKQNNYTTQGG
jgi:hypothetical protein